MAAMSKNGAVQELEEKMKRLTLGPDALTRRIIGQTGNFDELPFVNRYREVAELLAANALAIHDAVTAVPLKDYRGLRVAVASQMFGAGKTTLGFEFINQLNNEEASKHIEQHVRKAWPAELAEVILTEAVRARKAILVFVDLRPRSSFSQTIGLLHKCLELKGLDLPPFDENADDTVLMQHFINCLMRPREQPVFVFLDEVGVLDVEDLRKLRDCIYKLWVAINKSEDPREVPVTYFLLAGKGVNVSALGSPDSPVGTRWIILGPLVQEHISTVRERLKASGQLELKGLTQDGAVYLDKELSYWTGGYPRLLLYTFRVLQVLQGFADFSTREGIEACVLRVNRWLTGLPMVTSELFCEPEADKDMAEAWYRLMVLAQLKVPCTLNTLVRVSSGATFPLRTLLRQLNVYIARGDQDRPSTMPGDQDYPSTVDQQFVMQAVGYAVQFAQTTVATVRPFHVGLVLGNGPTLGLSYSKMLEQMVELRLLMNIGMASQISSPQATWGDVCPFLRGTVAAKEIPVLTDNAIHSMPEVRRTQPPKKNPAPEIDDNELMLQTSIEAKDLARMMLVAPPNIYRPKSEHSHSCDTAIPQPRCHIELQDKAYRKSELGFACLHDEVEKRAKVEDVKPVVLVIISLSLGAALRGAVGNNDVVVLGHGWYVPNSSKNGLLRKHRESGRWKTLIQGASIGVQKLQPNSQSNELRIPENVELVLVNPKAVREFLGSDCAALLDADEKVPTLPAAQALLDFFHWKEPGSAAEQPEEEQKVPTDRAAHGGNDSSTDPAGNSAFHRNPAAPASADNNSSASQTRNGTVYAGDELVLKLVDQDGDNVRLRLATRTWAALRKTVAQKLGVAETEITKIIAANDGCVVKQDTHVAELAAGEVLAVRGLSKNY